MSQTPTVWLKAIGTSKEPLPAQWLKERPDFLTRVTFAKQPKSIKSGDLIVYYAHGHKKIFAIGRATENGDTAAWDDTATTKYGYSMGIRILVAIPKMQIALDSPMSPGENSYIQLSATEYGLIVEALNTKLLDAAKKTWVH